MTRDELFLELPATGGPLRDRLAAALVEAVAAGVLRPGDPLPPTRALAARQQVSRGVVLAAYDQLQAAGYITTRQGAGTFVLPGADRAARLATNIPCAVVGEQELAADARPLVQWDLRPGHPETGLIDSRAWRAAWRAAAAASVGHEPVSARDHAGLQRELAEHLRRTRGIVARPEEVVITSGTAASLQLLGEALGLAGRTVAVEDPGYTAAWTALERCGVRVRHLPVDQEGLNPSLLRSEDAAVYVTPSHQYPLGMRIPVARRVQLLEEVRRNGAVILEDDYDGEFRFGAAPLPAIRSLAGADEHVVYLGTASKILTPDMALAWMIVPAPLLSAVRRARQALGLGPSPIVAAALEHLLSSGALTRHLARATRTYGARRQALVAALHQVLPEGRVEGVEAGLHLLLRLPSHVDDRELAAATRARGLEVQALNELRHRPGAPGLVLGYARLAETQAQNAVAVLASVVCAVAGAEHR